MSHYDAVIVGAGPVGLMLALGLAQQNRQVLLLEKTPPTVATEQTSFDGRVLALSEGSREALTRLGIWQALTQTVTPIKHVHVSQKGYLGITRLHASELQVPALGYSVTATDLGDVLWRAVLANPNVAVCRPATLVEAGFSSEQVELEVECEGKTLSLTTPFLVGADGTQSQVRQLLQLPLQEKAYDAVGIIAKIETEQAPAGWAFERFTTQGPVALLPMGGHFSKAVLVVPEAQKEQVMAQSDEAFMATFSAQMGERLGRYLSVSERVAYPLKESYAPEMTKGRAVLMGNASHTQHPVAAQGLNLGIRDVDQFLEMMQDKAPLGNPDDLNAYAAKRREDHEKVMQMTDGLIQIFEAPSPLIGHLRGLGLMALEALPPLKKRFARFAMRGMSQ